jgi:hypothetical protein
MYAVETAAYAKKIQQVFRCTLFLVLRLRNDSTQKCSLLNWSPFSTKYHWLN